MRRRSRLNPPRKVDGYRAFVEKVIRGRATTKENRPSGVGQRLRSVKANPGPVEGRVSGGLTCVGVLTDLEVLDPRTGKTKTLHFKNKWLAWDSRRKVFHICSVKGKAQQALPPHVAAAHRKFHHHAPTGAFVAEVPNPRGSLREVGLIKSLIYEVPGQIISPEKNECRWHHAFGDTGHKGGSNYPTKVMPSLRVDQANNLFIVRRPGNIFNVDTWLRG